MSALASQPHFASLSLLGVKAMAWRAGIQHRIGQGPRCEYRAHTTKCLERCLRVGSPVQTEIKLLLQIHRALAKRSVCCPDLHFQPLLLQKLHCWLFSALGSLCLHPGRQGMLSPWMSLCSKHAVHPWEEHCLAPIRRFPLPEQKWQPLPGELEGAA